ncbi:MAG: hypothetical protein E7619_05815 [Ruminococcaceae bacterium]|nr:hypothetical protein [Oscillospiraceae bacterium]
MKKLLAVLLATLTVFAVFPVALSQEITAVTTDNVAYLDAANGNDTTAALNDKSKPYATFKAAYNALAPGGGKLLFTAPYNVEQLSITGLKEHHGEIVITADGNYDNYWFMAAYDTAVGYYRQYTVKFAGPVTIENIALVESGKTTKAPSLAAEYIFANFNPLTIGNGVKCYSSKPVEGASIAVKPTVSAVTEYTTSTGTGISINGGALSIKVNSIGSTDSPTYAHRLNQIKRDTCVTVNSGAWRAVVGGARHDIATTTAYNGNYRLYINGGNILGVIGANWGINDTTPHAGGQSYIYMTGGTVTTLHTGHQSIGNAPLRNSILVWTGGKITGDIAVRNKKDTVILYGGDVSFAAAGDAGVVTPYTGAAAFTSGSDVRMLACNGQSCAIRPRDGSQFTVLPLVSSEGQTVYVDQQNGKLCGTGAENDPVSSYQVALAMFNQVGGNIVLAGDYTFSNDDTTSLYAFREPDHKLVTVNGGGYAVSNVASSLDTVALKSGSFTVSAGFDNYILSGDTTFKNIDLAFLNDMHFSANFNHLVMDENVEVTSEKAVILLGANYYPAGREAGGNTYNANFRPQFANHSTDDTHITVKSGNFRVSAFSRVLHGDKVLPYGNGTVDVLGGTVTTLYGSSIEADYNSAFSAANSTVINISGGVVETLYMGGAYQDAGTVGSLTVNVSDKGIVEEFNNMDNCTGTATYNITNGYLNYKRAIDAFKDVDTTNVIINPQMDDIAFNIVEYGAKYVGPDNYGLRASFSIGSSYFEENADFYNIVEMGVLVKASANENALTYIKGKDFYPTSLEAAENTENYDPDTKIAKSIAYVKGADINNYKYAGPEADDTNVYFTAPITQLTAAHGETMFTFMPYVVVADAADGEHMVVYGEAYEQNLYLVVYALAEGIESEEECTDDATLAAYNILVDINGYINSEE